MVNFSKIISLEDGWLNGDGIAPCKENIKWLIGKCKVFLSDVEGDVFPIPDGNVVIEWNIDEYYITFDIDFKSHIGVFDVWDTRKDINDSLNVELDLEKHENWEFVRVSIQCKK